MGYDFSFVCLTPRPTTFPLHPQVGGPWNVKPLRAWEAVERWFIESGRFRPNGAVGKTRFYRWEAADHAGLLDVSVNEKSVHVDVHASWSEVAKLYRLLLPFENDLLIADHQTGWFYDAAAFDAFIDESRRTYR